MALFVIRYLDTNENKIFNEIRAKSSLWTNKEFSFNKK